jgi:hypothetical protein
MERLPVQILSAVIGFIFIVASDAHAQLPFYTDDTDTTPKGKFHIEVFNEHDLLQASAYPAKRQNTLVFTLDYGITDKLEFGINAPYLTFMNSRIVERRNPSGVGDTQFGLKYNFYAEHEGSRLPAMAVVFYFEAPTGNAKEQFGSGLNDYWLYGILQKSFTKKTKGRLNGGILFSGNETTGLIGIDSTRGQIYTGNGSARARVFGEAPVRRGTIWGSNRKFQIATRSTHNTDWWRLSTHKEVNAVVCFAWRPFYSEPAPWRPSRFRLRLLTCLYRSVPLNRPPRR